MKTAALFLICLLGSSFAFQLQKHQLPPLQQISFGNIFAEIRAQLAAGGPYEQIFGLLDDLEAQIRNEQSEHDAMYDASMEKCREEDAFRTGEIAEAESALKRATTHHRACQNSWDSTKVDLAQNLQDQLDTEDALSIAIHTREQENALYKQRVDDHNRATVAIEGAIDIIEEMTAGEATLVQLSRHSANLLQTGITLHMAGVYAPAVALLAQMATSEDDLFVDEGAVARIREMLEHLIENIAASLADYQFKELEQQEAFEILAENLKTAIRELKEMQVKLEDHIDEMEQCVLEEEVIIQSSQAKYERNSNLLAKAKTMCEATAIEYKDMTSARQEELELLQVVRGMVNKRLGGGAVSEHIVSRDDAFEEHTSVQYEAAEFEHDREDYDAAGAEGAGFGEEQFVDF